MELSSTFRFSIKIKEWIIQLYIVIRLFLKLHYFFNSGYDLVAAFTQDLHRENAKYLDVRYVDSTYMPYISLSHYSYFSSVPFLISTPF